MSFQRPIAAADDYNGTGGWNAHRERGFNRVKALEDSSDAEIMQRVQAGDDHGFGEIVRRYQAALRRLAFSRLGQSDLAEEAVQETFVSAFQARHRYNSDFAFSTWLWTICTF